MPFLPSEFLETAIFLYPTRADAEARVKWGGSGFLVGIPSEANHSRVHLYAVTNEHVAGACPVIRLALRNGSAAIKDAMPSEWIDHPDGDDLSVCPLGAVAAREYFYVGAHVLLKREDLGPDAIGPGDDCLMIGRYVNHDGEQFDRAVVRFGNIAMLPEKVWQPKRSFDQESFLVDVRSLAGFSGSQTWVYFATIGMRGLENEEGGVAYASTMMNQNARLLGVDWGHLPVWEDVRDQDNKRIGSFGINSGMAAIVPAWKLAELLNSEVLMKGREKTEHELTREADGGPVLDVVAPDAQSDEFARFEDLTHKLVKVPKKELDEKRKSEET